MIRQWIENIEELCLRVRWRYLRWRRRLERGKGYYYGFWLWNRDRMSAKGCSYTGLPGHLWSRGVPYRGGNITKGTREGGGRRSVDHPEDDGWKL